MSSIHNLRSVGGFPTPPINSIPKLTITIELEVLPAERFVQEELEVEAKILAENNGCRVVRIYGEAVRDSLF